MLFHIQFNSMFTQTTCEVDQGSPLRKIEGSPVLFQGVQHRISRQKLQFVSVELCPKAKLRHQRPSREHRPAEITNIFG